MGDQYTASKEAIDNGEAVSAFTVAELGELLPDEIHSDVLNKRFPFQAEVNDKDNPDAFLEHQEKVMEDFKSVFSELYDFEGYEDGFGYGIRLNYGRGKKIQYFFNTDEWECNYEVFEVAGDTEADTRAKMLIYLKENNLH